MIEDPTHKPQPHDAVLIFGLRRELLDETQRRVQFEEEVKATHRWLDEHGAPRTEGAGEVLSLIDRIMRLPPD